MLCKLRHDTSTGCESRPSPLGNRRYNIKTTLHAFPVGSARVLITVYDTSN